MREMCIHKEEEEGEKKVNEEEILYIMHWLLPSVQVFGGRVHAVYHSLHN